MKRCLSILFALGLLLTLAACAAEPVATETPVPEPAPVVEPPAPLEPFPGKIAIITNAVDADEEPYRSAQQVVEKYGEDKIIHVTWPVNFMQEQEQMIKIAIKVTADPEVRALVINRAVPGTNAAVAKLKETREDIFVVYCVPHEKDTASMTEFADLILEENMVNMGYSMAQQAQKLGAKTFVHYSFSRHMSQAGFSAQHNLLEKTCAELGIALVNATVPDPTSEIGIAGAQQYILEDVPKMVTKYGADTAFFATNCSMQIPLIKAVADEGGIYPQPCCPSPYHGFPRALEIETPEDGLATTDYIISETTRILGEKGVLGRFSTWPASIEMLFTSTGAEYAIKRLNGEVTQEGIDVAALKQLMENYAGVECFIQTYVDEVGVEYPNLYLVREDYITFGEEYFKPEASIPSAKVAAEWPSDFWVKDGVLLEYIGNDTDIVLLSGLFSIADEVFAYCYNMQTITIPNTVGSVGRGAFLGCSSLQSLVLPQGITKIRSRTFEGCSSLASINIPNSVTEIDWDTFSGCTSLQSVTISNSVSIIR